MLQHETLVCAQQFVGVLSALMIGFVVASLTIQIVWRFRRRDLPVCLDLDSANRTGRRLSSREDRMRLAA